MGAEGTIDLYSKKQVDQAVRIINKALKEEEVNFKIDSEYIFVDLMGYMSDEYLSTWENALGTGIDVYCIYYETDRSHLIDTIPPPNQEIRSLIEKIYEEEIGEISPLDEHEVWS